MSRHSIDFYHAAIKNSFPDAYDIRLPVVRGGVNPVFLADCPGNRTKVCKFCDSDIVFRNRVVSHLMTWYDIPVPFTEAHAYLDSWFETYDYCPDKTLTERIESGFSNGQIFQVYKQAIDVQAKISRINPIEFKARNCKYFSDVFRISMRRNMHNILADTYTVAVRVLAGGDQVRLLHGDIHAKNMLVDDDGNLTRLIDLDAVALCNDDFAFLMMLRTYPLDNWGELMDYYEHATECKLNRGMIMKCLRLLETIRTYRRKLDAKFWRGEYPHKTH